MKNTMKNRLRDVLSSRKGFTLVELIVVLVILAILAAITVPALTGWIDKAKDKQSVVHARTVYLAAQTIVAERYAQLDEDDFAAAFDDVLTVTDACMDEDTVEGAIAALADIRTGYTAEITVKDGTITGMIYTPDSGKAVTLGDAESDE